LKRKPKEPFTGEFIWCNLVLFFLVVFTCYAVPHIALSSAAPRQLPDRPVVILDPGHGGVDGGASTADGVAEKGINLNISLLLRDFLRSAGVEVVMTRETDLSIHDDSATTIRKKKASDLNNRLAIARKNPTAIFISIHQNKFEQSQYHGAQIFYSKNHERSRSLAQAIDASIKRRLQPGNKRELKQGGKNLFLLWNSPLPTVLVECGFLSNPVEAQKLQTEAYQREMAFSIFCGIEAYLNEIDSAGQRGEPSALPE